MIKETTNITKLINNIAKRVLNERAKILDDFMLAYCGGRKLTKEQIKRLELVEERTGSGAIYSFRLKRGKLKENKDNIYITKSSLV
jgi:hypothetical protein